MADIAGLIGPVIEVAKWLAAPIKRQFNYLCCFTSNITILKEEAGKLQDIAADLQRKVDREKDNLQDISRQVNSWLQKSNDIKHEIDEILNEVPNVESDCLKFGIRYSLSKRVKKTSDQLKELRGECKFDVGATTYPGPPAATQAIPIGTTYEFKSRKQIEKDIMATLKVGDVNTVGIWGMGGLGKTTMAKRIMNRALKDHEFDEVVMAVVSQPVDKLKIQDEISGTLGLKLQGETSHARAQKLHTRLSGTKRILLVLDDVWEGLVLEDLGIPRNHKGCTILLTSRNRDVFSEMDVQKIMGMDVLSKEDARFLFGQRAGACVDDIGLSSIANEIVNECKGLPIALITVGSALKDKMNVGIWRDALRRLRQCDPNIPGFLANVYNPLKLSYDVLNSEQKSVLLLCCLYPEDANISLERLTYFSMGLEDIFEGGITNVEDARNSICSLASTLKSRSLLLDSDKGDDYVKMHDVVRDVCIFIAKQQKNISGNDCSWISSSQEGEIPSTLGFPNLRLIFWICDSANKKLKVDSNFLEGIRDLHVLCIVKDSFTSLPCTTQSLKNLKTLVIVSCDELETLSAIGELVRLEILVCRNCNSIKELPSETKKLTRLKVLHITGCQNLKRIGRGIISSLLELEELKMRWSFREWEGEDREKRENAGLKELEALTKLRCLEIDIKDHSLASENMQLSSNVDRYRIIFSSTDSYRVDIDRFNKTLCLRLEGAESCIGRWIEMQTLRHTECLVLQGNGANNVELAKTENIRWLTLGECDSMMKMVKTSSNGDVFSSMERLELFSLPKLEKIWDDPIWLNLKELHLWRLPALKQLWKSSGVDLEKDYLPHLETLRIRNCKKMEQVFMWVKNENESHQMLHITKRFPKLKTIYLYNLPNLTSFYHGIQGVEFPQLSELTVQRCKKLNWMVSEGNDNNSGGGGSSSNALIHHPLSQTQEVSLRCLKLLITNWAPFAGHIIPLSIFNGLEELQIDGYQGSMNLFSSSIAGALVNLRKLNIWRCNEMVKVISDEEEEVVSGGERRVVFPKLQELYLEELPKLVSFCEWKCEVELPLLSKVEILRCPNMKNFSLGPLVTPKLTSVEIEGGDFESTTIKIESEYIGGAKDLNDALQQQWRLREEKQEKIEEAATENEAAAE